MSEEQNNDKQPYYHLEAGVPIFTPPLEEPYSSAKVESKSEGTYQHKQNAIQRRILLTQIGLLIISAIGGGVAIWQANIAQQSVDISDRSLLLAQKAERDGRMLAEKQAVSGQRQFDETSGQMKAQTRAQIASAKAAQMSERPMVVIERFEAYGFTANPLPNKTVMPSRTSISSGVPIAANIFFANVGKSPALGLQTYRHIAFGIPEIDKILPDKPKRGTQDLASGIPASEVTAISVKKDLPEGHDFDIDASSLRPWDGSFPIFIYGEFIYYDRFGNEYCSPFIKVSLDGILWADAGAVGLNDTEKARTSRLCPKRAIP